ncbi:MAG TPA: lysylphosphatidylglycerol synthase transmembrane domain-containing protein [Candidatus Limnocylindrales bacterium]|nr:lysylphosphatidylglycerol synthase transmembrane domain-containing protein [Candidatus Limnocylindrales bacterium]
MSEPTVPDATPPPESTAGPYAEAELEAEHQHAAEEIGAEAIEDRGVEPDDAVERISLSGRLRQTKTIVSILVPLAIIAVFVGLNWATLSKVPGLIAGANPLLVLAAFGIFYVGFPLRGLRWSMLLKATGFRILVKDATEILYLSWLVNCLVPAKLGDVYRAYLLRINSDASLSRTFGTVFIERVLDIFTIAILGIAAGYWSFRNNVPPQIQVLFGVAVVIVVLLAIALFTLRNFGRRILVALPFPQRVVELYDRFEDGVFSALDRRQLPGLAILGIGIWMTEALRLFFVVKALGFDDVELGISGAVFVALIGSLLTAVPLSPAGLGIVEAGIVGVLTVVYKVPLAEATAIALLDRVISVFSVIVFGAILYAVSGKPKGAGLRRPVEAPATG